MSAATHSSEDSRVKEQNRDDNSENSVVSPPGSTGSRTENDLLGGRNDDSHTSCVSSTHTTIMETYSDDEMPFDPDLPTGYGGTDQATLAKEPVVKDMTPEVDDAKSEKKAPRSSVKEITEGTEASKPTAIPEIPIIDKPVTNIKLGSSCQDEEKAEDDLLHVRMLTKEDFKKYSHLKSGRYYLPESPSLNENGRKSGLTTNLAGMASLYSCGATYQRCYPEVAMFRIGSATIDDISPLIIQYYDNLCLYVKCGYPVSIIVPVLPKATEELADIFQNLGKESKPTIMGDFKMVVVNPNQKVETPLEEGEIEKALPQCAAAPPMIVFIMKVNVQDDTDTRIQSDVIDILLLDMRIERDLLHKEDMHKYMGDEKFNPKSFKSGSSLGILIWTQFLMN